MRSSRGSVVFPVLPRRRPCSLGVSSCTLSFLLTQAIQADTSFSEKKRHVSRRRGRRRHGSATMPTTISCRRRILPSPATRIGEKTFSMTSSSLNPPLPSRSKCSASTPARTRASPSSRYDRKRTTERVCDNCPVAIELLSYRISRGHRRETHIHALVQHVDIMIERIKDHRPDPHLVTRPASHQLSRPQTRFQGRPIALTAPLSCSSPCPLCPGETTPATSS